ncbi:MAG: phage portal protein [Porphyrobacter sp.]|jgi:HK97 family phage portal protein|nr:phage portal protein [Porphyrobacter sp.]
MNFFTKAFARFTSSLTQMRHGAQSLMLGGLLRRTRFDYRRAVGDMLDASVVTAPVGWVQRALPEATLALRQKLASGKVKEIEEHPLLDLIRNPNPFYSDIALWGATAMMMLIHGNGYWLKVRSASGRVVELWFAPSWMIEPKPASDGSAFIDHYVYTPGNGAGRYYLAPEDVIHFRNGLNPRAPYLGLSPMDGVIREIFADMESSNFVASLLRNMGVPGVVISPKTGGMASPDDVEATKAWFKQAFGGDNRGQPMVMGAPTEVQPFGFNPQQMNLTEARDVAEERVCAAIGIPAAVVGFGAGLQQTKVGATMEELRKLAWHNGVLPLARAMADELQRSLLPDFERGNRRIELYWDTSDVLALQEDENKATERKLKELQAGAITLYDYLVETGREADDSHRYYLRPFSVIEVPLELAGQGAMRQVAAPAPAAAADPAIEPEKRRALPAPQVKDRGTGIEISGQPNASLHETKNSEDWLPDDARPASPDAIARGEQFVTMLQRQERGLRTGFEDALRPAFESWGDLAGRIARDVLIASGFKQDARGIETKQESNLIQQIIDLLNLEAWEQQLSSIYQGQYLRIAREVASAVEESGFGTSIPDPVMRQIIATGGTRAGLVDVPGQTRAALFEALAEGRAEGEGAQALANRIANMIEGGPWGNADTRARVIARTETKHAQNISTIEAGRANGVSEFVVFDGRFGEPRSELSHIARDGMIVSAEDAWTMAANMRPNCTLSFAPNFSL